MSGMGGAAQLREARLRLSEEGGRHLYLLSDPASGRILRLEPGIARLMTNVRARLLGRLRGEFPEDEVAAATVIGELIRAMRADASGEKSRKFNPLFMQIPLFDVGPWQRPLQNLSRITFSSLGLVAFLLLSCVCIWIHAASGGAMVEQIGDIFSLSALATFALIAPLTKVVHELGHVLAATRSGVRVRKAGVMLLGLYPLPFVDCSEADLLARRRGRIMISLGGLFADLAVAMGAFVAWHLVEGDVARQILSSLFVFTSINTVLFNLNPILKLDGYFALSDALHRRNWHTESAVALKTVRAELAQFDFRAAAAEIWRSPLRVLFALASTAYKIWIVAFIAWQVLPKFLGVGLLVVAWGIVAMFFSPLMKLAGPSPQGRGQGGLADVSRSRSRGWLWLPIVVALAGAIALIPRPYHVTLPVELDVAGTYAQRTQEAGVLREIRAAGTVRAGDVLARFDAPGVRAELDLAQAELAFDLALAESVAGLDPLTAEGARRRALASATRVERLSEVLADTVVTATTTGAFRPQDGLRPGVQTEKGRVIGALLPEEGASKLVGEVPEIWVEKIVDGLDAVELRWLSGFEAIAPDRSFALDAIAVEGRRSLRARLTSERAAIELAGEPTAIRLTTEPEPLWRHVQFRARLLLLQFREAQRQAQIAATD